MLWASLRGLGTVGLIWFGSGCGSGDALTCRSGPAYDCLEPLTDEAKACGHPFSNPGTLDAAGLVCTFNDGSTVEWTTSARETSPTDGSWGFTVRKDGAVCMRFDQTVQGSLTTKVVETKGRIYREVMEEKVTSIRFVTTCPDGVTFDDTEARQCTNTARHIAFTYGGKGSGGFLDIEFRLGTSNSIAQEAFEVFKCAGF
jgi:hypothetical protein